MKVWMTGWREGFSVIETCKMLVATGNCNLPQAKRACESVLEGGQAVLEVDSVDQASKLVQSLEYMHVTSTIER